MFRALKIRNYRLYLTGNLVSQTGTWANRVAQDWLVLELTDNDPVALGIATALQFGPTLLLSLWGGMLADRYDKRRALIWIQGMIGLSAATLGMLTVTGQVQVWHVYAICLVVGFTAAVEGPFRMSFVSEMVGPTELPNAVGLNAMAFNTARIIGPSIAGVGIAVVGTGWVQVISGLAYAGVMTSLALMRMSELFPSKPVPRGKGQVREGVRYVAGRPDLVLILSLLFVVATFGMNFQITLAILAKIVFERDAASFGLLTTALAVGALIGATLSARRQSVPRFRLLVGTAFTFGFLELCLGLFPSYALVAILLVPTGMFMLLFANAANASVQLTTDPTMRGRVMGLYMVVFLGGTPFIAPLVGVLAQHAGGAAPLIVGGIICMVGATVVGIWIARHDHLRLEVHRRPRLSIHLTKPDEDHDHLVHAPDPEHLSIPPRTR
ncbi:MFS transporter [Nakamurella silvestris]|nr:MFS transporter [Nakamurella silvestris]